MNNFTKRRVPKNMLQKSLIVPTLRLKNIAVANTLYNEPKYNLLTPPDTMGPSRYKSTTYVNINLE